MYVQIMASIKIIAPKQEFSYGIVDYSWHGFHARVNVPANAIIT